MTDNTDIVGADSAGDVDGAVKAEAPAADGDMPPIEPVDVPPADPPPPRPARRRGRPRRASADDVPPPGPGARAWRAPVAAAAAEGADGDDGAGAASAARPSDAAVRASTRWVAGAYDAVLRALGLPAPTDEERAAAEQGALTRAERAALEAAVAAYVETCDTDRLTRWVRRAPTVGLLVALTGPLVWRLSLWFRRRRARAAPPEPPASARNDTDHRPGGEPWSAWS